MTVRIVLNRRGVRELLRSPEIQRDLRRRAEAIARVAGPGHEVDTQVGRNRARAAVITGTFEAAHNEATNRSLTRAIDAGRT
jgi:hypothetical protein